MYGSGLHEIELHSLWLKLASAMQGHLRPGWVKRLQQPVRSIEVAQGSEELSHLHGAH